MVLQGSTRPKEPPANFVLIRKLGNRFYTVILRCFTPVHVMGFLEYTELTGPGS